MVSSTSMFTSCKDYDDDINNLVVTKADKTALEEAKQTLENEISGLRQQLSEAEGKITTLTNNKADKFKVGNETYNLETVWNQLFPLLERVSTCESQIGEHQTAINAINEMIGGKISESDYFKDCKNYQEALIKTYALAAAASQQAGENLTAITELKNKVNDPVTGLAAVYTDLQGQISALNTLKGRVDVIEGDYLTSTDKQDLLTKIQNLTDTVKAHEVLIYEAIRTAEANAKAFASDTATKARNEAYRLAQEYTNGKFDELAQALADSTKMLKDEQQKLSDRIDKNLALINTLNVFVRQALRGLVFSMDSYYAGIEATDLTVLWYKKYTMEATNADSIEKRGYNGGDWTAAAAADETNYLARLAEHDWSTADLTTRYYATEENNSKVLTFQAKYFMNPSSAAISSAAGTVGVIASDKPYHLAIDTIVNNNGETEIALPKSEFNGKNTTYEAEIKVVDWKTKDGMLIVDYDCTHPEKIRSILSQNAVTVFATTVQVSKDTTVTSDFAALYKQDVKEIRISHTPQTANGFANHNGALIHNGQFYGSYDPDVVNTHCGYCSIDNTYKKGLHLMQTVAEAAGEGTGKFKTGTAGGFDCQDSVGYKDTLDLMKLVEIHYTTYDANGQNPNHQIMPADMIKAAGLKFKFTLTGLYYGSNGTSESAHAAILNVKDKDGNDSIWWLRPQMPDSVIRNNQWEGVAVGWNATRKGTLVGTQARQTVGRTPIVRVELVMPDPTDSSKEVVVDYGYIRIKIVERPTAPDPEDIYMREYETPGMTASQDFCADLNGTPFSFTQRWIQMEYDIQSDIDITQEQFEANYTYDGSSKVFDQFYLNAGVPTECTANGSATDALGTISILPNPENEQTSVIEWVVTDADLAAYVAKINNDATKANVTRVVRFEKRGTSTLPAPKYPTYIYVAFIPKPGLTISAEPTVSGVLNWENEFNKRNTDNWYAKNANGNPAPKGLVEIHAQTLSPEDNQASAEWTGKADSLTTHLPDVFTKATNAAGVPNKLITPTADAYDKFITVSGADIKGRDLKLDLVFVDSTGSKTFKGNDGAEYKLAPIADGKALGAYNKKYSSWDLANAADRDTIAIMYFDQATACDARDSINHWTVSYCNDSIADALLNYKAHNQLADDVVKAVVGVKAKYLTCDVPLSKSSFDIRFLRPINVESADTTLADASASGLQQIFLRDIVKFTDWRDEPFKTEGQMSYWYYYQIKYIEVANVNVDEFISVNPDVLTDLDLPDSDKGNIEKANPLQSKNNLIDFKYTSKPTTPVCKFGNKEDYGVLTYSNFSNTTQQFHIWLPVKVTYLWGDIYTTMMVTIKGTQGNARLAK